MRVFTDGSRSVAGRTSTQPSSEGVNASSEEGLGNPPFSWQFVKSALDTTSCLEMVELLAIPAFSTHSSPSMAAFPAAFFYCLRATEPGAVFTTSTNGSPTPQARAFAGCWCGHNEGTGPLKGCTPQRSFFTCDRRTLNSSGGHS